MPRLFTGIELPEDIRDELGDLDQPLPGARWIDIDDLHLTLRFAGDVDNRTAIERPPLDGVVPRADAVEPPDRRTVPNEAR